MRNNVNYLDRHEIGALLAAPDRNSWHGRRDHALVAFGGDRHDPSDRLEVLGVHERCVPVEGVDRCQPVVARPRAVAAVLFEVVEERADQRRVEVVDVQLTGLFADLFGREREQQPEGVTV